MIVVFEGADASGKDTLRKAFERATDYVFPCITRLHPSILVFASYFRRANWVVDERRDKLLREAKEFYEKNDVVYVWLTVTPDTSATRMLRRGEDPDKEPDPIVIHNLYTHVWGLMGIVQLILESHDRVTPEQLAERVKDHVFEMMKAKKEME